MHVLVAYSQPRGKYGRYVFTVMIHFAEKTETAEIAVMRPQTQTQTAVKYSCDHCGRWASIVTHQRVTTTPLQPVAHQKDGRLELYRYDNVDPKDWMELVLKDSKMWAYQLTNVLIRESTVDLQHYWRYIANDQEFEDYAYERYISEQQRDPSIDSENFYSQKARDTYTRTFSEDTQKEMRMKDEVLYDVSLMKWDAYVQTRTEDMGEVRVEEELIKQTMNAEEVTIKELVLEPAGQLPAIEGVKGFIEGTLKRQP